MLTRPYDERRKMANYKHAHNTFILAEGLLLDLQKNRPQMEPEARYAAECSIAILYFRPFMQKPKSDAVSESWVPQQYRRHHNRLRHLRNKTHGHVDMVKSTEMGDFPTKFVFMLNDKHEPEFGMAYDTIQYGDLNYDGYASLIHQMAVRMQNEATAIWNNWVQQIDLGEMLSSPKWMLNVSLDDDRVFVPYSS